MHPVKTIALGLLAWPAAEFVVFICVAAAVGFIKAIIMLVLMSMAGLLVLRHFSGGHQRIHTADGFVTASAWSGGTGPGLGGILLLIPGFLSTVAGILVLFPLTRRWLLAGLRHLFASRTSRTAAEPDVIDLKPDEWRSLSGENLPPSGRTPPK